MAEIKIDLGGLEKRVTVKCYDARCLHNNEYGWTKPEEAADAGGECTKREIEIVGGNCTSRYVPQPKEKKDDNS